MSDIFACNCPYEKKSILKSNREYDYFGSVIEYEYSYFALYLRTNMINQKVLILRVQSMITPFLTEWQCIVGVVKPESVAIQLSQV